MDREKRDAIVREYRGDFPSSSFVPWVKVSEDSCDSVFKRTSIYFVDWFDKLEEITLELPFGGLSVDCNWYSKYNYFTTLYSSEFLMNGELYNFPNKTISSIRYFQNDMYLADFSNQIRIIDWGLITKNNLLVSFISHNNYVKSIYNKPSGSYDEMCAKAMYQIKMLFNKTEDIYPISDTSLSKYFCEEFLVLCNYSITEYQTS